MQKEDFADKTLGWFERLIESPRTERACWAGLAVAALYFGGIILAVVMR